MEAVVCDCSAYGTSDSEIDLQDMNEDEEDPYMSVSIPKLQFRNDVSKGRWDAEMGMAEVIEKKGGMWTTTGIVRRSKLYCSIEETLFLVERGAFLLLGVDDAPLSLKDIYEKVAGGKSGICWESFEAYRHLKSLGYIVGRHGVPWTMKMKNDKICCNSTPLQGKQESNGVSEREPEESISITNRLRNMQISEVKPTFEVYLPNSKFRKSSPGNPNFVLCLTRVQPPTKLEIEDLESRCNGIPLKFCHVEHGRVSFFSFDRTVLPVLP